MLQGRREILKTFGVAASVLTAGVLGLRTLRVDRSPTCALGLRAGMKFGGCSVMRVDAAHAGGIPLTLAGTDGGVFHADVLRHDPRAPGVARAGSLSVYLSNNGNGSTRTIEEHGLAAMAIAAFLARREAKGATMPQLLTLAERNRRRQELRASV